MAKESISWVKVGAEAAIVAIISAAVAWGSAVPAPLRAGLAGGSAGLVAMVLLVRASILRRKAETREAFAMARAEKSEATLGELSQSADRSRALESSRWAAGQAIRAELLLNTNVGEPHFRSQSRYGARFSEVALLVLRSADSRVQFFCRLTNLAPFPIMPVSIGVKAVLCSLHDLRLEADEPNVPHPFKEIPPAHSELVRVQMRADASQCKASDSGHLAVVGRILVRSERWSGIQEVSISTSAWGIIVDERPEAPTVAEFVPPQRSPLQGGGS